MMKIEHEMAINHLNNRIDYNHVIEGKEYGTTGDEWFVVLDWYCRNYTDKIRLVIRNDGPTSILYNIIEVIYTQEINNGNISLDSLNNIVIDILPPVTEIKVSLRNSVTGVGSINNYEINYIGVAPR